MGNSTAVPNLIFVVRPAMAAISIGRRAIIW
jgi:hypothetical protein